MTTPFNFNPDLISTDPIVARNFYLEFDQQRLVLQGVSGLEIAVDVVSTNQNGWAGMQQHIKTMGGVLQVPDITVTRMAPVQPYKDPIWTWFNDIRAHGMKAVERGQKRKDGSIILFDAGLDEVGRFNWFSGWPSKIATSELTSDSQAPMTETITLVVERIERVLSPSG